MRLGHLIGAAAALGLLNLAAPICAEEKPTRYRLFLETGAAWQNRNDTQIPGDTGTRFSLAKLTDSGPYPHLRLMLLYDLNARTGLRFVVAPFGLTETGALDKDVTFEGANFQSGTPTEGSYKFNSYRATYWYRFHQDHRADWRAGLTLKVREARIALRQGNVAAAKNDLGVVPLLHLSGDYRLNDRWILLVDFDGLAAPQGRAFDLGLSLGYALHPDWTLTFGYRTLEGGADNDRVYTFAWFNYLTVGFGYRF
jgi:hypothetical protein